MASLVTPEAIAQAVQDLERENLKPTVTNVRTKLGGGSNTKILPLLNEYLKSVRPEIPAISEEDFKAIKKIVEQVSESRAEKAVEIYKDQQEVLEARIAELSRLNAELEENNNQLSIVVREQEAQIVQQKTQIQALDGSLAEVKGEREQAVKKAQDLEKQLNELTIRKGDWEEAKVNLEKTREEAFEAKLEIAKLQGKLVTFEKIKESLTSLVKEPDQKPVTTTTEKEATPFKISGKGKK
jgi:chromosome segregation ATPase